MILLSLVASLASALDSTPSPPPPEVPSVGGSTEPADTEIVVYGDLFSRWDETRWLVKTEMVLPYEMRLQRDVNNEFDTSGLQVHAVLVCDKDIKLGRHRWQVNCRIEDIAVVATVGERPDLSERRLEIAQSVLDEIDDKLTGAALQLQVDDRGQVVSVDLEGVVGSGGRIEENKETMTSILSRVTSGFDLRLRPGNQLHEGKWSEYDVALMKMPLPSGYQPTVGSNVVVHYLNRFRGNTIVQSIGHGLIDAQESIGSQFETNLIGVSLFDYDEGYMTERVWALSGESTAGTMFSKGVYWNAGRIQMLGKDDHPDLGPTRLVAPRGEHRSELPDWTPIDP